MTLYVRKPSGRYRVAEPVEIVERALAAIRPTHRTKIGSPRDVHDFLALKFAGRTAEAVAILFLDTRHRLIEFREMFHGTIDGATVHPREIVRACIDTNAAAIIMAHNHPSGEPEPSDHDRAITERIASACKLIDVRLLDHIVLGGADSVSLAERGWL